MDDYWHLNVVPGSDRDTCRGRGCGMCEDCDPDERYDAAEAEELDALAARIRGEAT